MRSKRKKIAFNPTYQISCKMCINSWPCLSVIELKNFPLNTTKYLSLLLFRANLKYRYYVNCLISFNTHVFSSPLYINKHGRLYLLLSVKHYLERSRYIECYHLLTQKINIKGNVITTCSYFRQ